MGIKLPGKQTIINVVVVLAVLTLAFRFVPGLNNFKSYVDLS